MADGDSELRLAAEELAFWRDFAQWWRDKHGAVNEPRVHQALARAERRYQRASNRSLRPQKY